MTLHIAGRQKKVPEDFEGVVHGIPQVSIFTGARAHRVLSPTSLLQVLGALSPLQLTGGSTRPAVENVASQASPRCFPRKDAETSVILKGQQSCGQLSALPTAFSFPQMPSPSPPLQPLCYRTRGSRSSPTCQCLSQSLSFLSLHGSTCQGCGQGKTALEHGCVCLGCWERAGWNDILQGSMMAFPERVIPNNLTHFLSGQLRNAATKAKTHGLLEDGGTHGIAKFLAIALLAW